MELLKVIYQKRLIWDFCSKGFKNWGSINGEFLC